MEWMKKGLMAIGVIALAGFFLNSVQGVGQDTENAGSGPETTNNKAVNDYNIYAIDFLEKLDFAGESVPLDEPDIRERMDRELLVNTYWQSNGLLLIKRAHKYFPVIEPILAKHGVPDDFKYLAVIESGLQNVVSPARATGFWQIMSSTGKEYGLEVNQNVDERYHLEKSTEVACEYLKKAKARFGSWTMAAAAYNAGQAGMARQQTRQKEKDYYDILLGEETGRYIFRILAVKEILSDPYKYGFNIEKKHMYTMVPTKKIKVDYEIDDLTDFAREHGINYKILKIHNPWLRETKLNNKSRKKYFIEIPEKGYYEVRSVK
ncbi:lytic transglycosylase domain-containing protein [Sinomicrobium weinanense]|uniref:Lytic transglycosylase domain-containing protein n=1 Tax=Sinomicrobium weinanense TaxID=2842200 RepID=A0A926JRK2_9FLAO|nr:lytic transglycosylase domain-containing protein [Sinomicrobium weinanense]MBC9795993.1 lytic transglycosylase domain-containing protein [Sinomicrobium weinanense]MBU3122112.1 lytic transglycosylase domain-containing protein [Sinomicrobium weinanense]